MVSLRHEQARIRKDTAVHVSLSSDLHVKQRRRPIFSEHDLLPGLWPGGRNPSKREDQRTETNAVKASSSPVAGIYWNHVRVSTAISQKIQKTSHAQKVPNKRPSPDDG